MVVGVREIVSIKEDVFTANGNILFEIFRHILLKWIVMKNKLFILLITILIYSSCRSNEKIMNVNIHFSKISDGAFSDYYELEEIIPLETNDSSVYDCDYVDEYIFVNDKIYVGVDEGTDIKVFDGSGKYLHAINRSGNGPQEYGPDYRSLYLADSSLLVRNYDAEMIYYDLNGNFIRKLDQPVSVWSNQVGVLPDGNLIANQELNGLTAYTRDSVLNKTPYYSVQIYSPDGKLLKNLLEKPKFNTNLYIMGGRKGIYNDGKRVWIAPYVDDLIYAYEPKDTVLSPVFRIKVAGVDLETDLNLLKNPKTAQKFVDRKGSYDLLAVTKNYLLLNVIEDEKKRYVALIEKKTGKAELFYKKNNPDRENQISVNGIVPSNLHGKILVQIGYSQLTDDKGNLKESPVVKELSKRMEINENMNPVLCIYKEK